MKLKLTKITERRSLTFPGWIVLLGSVAILLLITFPHIHGFLAVSRPVKAEILVIDGLLPGYAYDTVVKFIERDNYKCVVTTGVDVDYLYGHDDGFNSAELSYKILLSKNLKNCRIEKAPCRSVLKDRTFSSALALRKWMHENGFGNQDLNVITLGCHARRTNLLYRKAFSGEGKTGIISIADRSYDPGKWYKGSQGVRIVMSEVIGYAYNIIFFHPKVIRYTEAPGS